MALAIWSKRMSTRAISKRRDRSIPEQIRVTPSSHFRQSEFSCARAENSATQRVKTSPRNVTPFTLDGWPLDTLDQTTLVELRNLADQTGWTVADIMHDLMEEFVARRKADKEREAKIIRFPKR